MKAGLGQGAMLGQMYLAEFYSRTEQFEKAVEMYRATIASTGGRMQGTTYYNLACAYSRMGKKKEACDSLKRAVGASFRNVQWMKKDGDLDAIRGEPEYVAIERELSGVEKSDPESPQPPPPQPEEPGGQTE